MEKTKRNGTGRKKTILKKIAKRDALQVCFSKRRSGLFKKAGELSALCGTEIAVIAFSPGGKAFVFGNPSPDSIIDRYLNHPQHGSAGPMELHDVVGLESPPTTEEELQRHFWLNVPIDNLGMEELVHASSVKESWRISRRRC